MRIPFGVKIGFAICLCTLPVTFAGVYFFYTDTKAIILKMTGDRLQGLARLSLQLLTDKHRQSILTLRQQSDLLAVDLTSEELRAIESDAEYLSATDRGRFEASEPFQGLVQVLRKIMVSSYQEVLPYRGRYDRATTESMVERRVLYAAYILVTVPDASDSNVVRFIADADYNNFDKNKNGKIDVDNEYGTPFGLLYNVSKFPGLRQAFDGESQADENFTTDKWGTVISGYAPIKTSDGSVLAILGLDMRADTEFNRLKDLENLSLAILAVSFLTSILASILLGFWFSKPVKLLHKGAERVRSGDYDTNVRIPRVTHDEFDTLVETFNEMVAQVRDHTENLEAKVTARTAELQGTLRRVQDLKNQQDCDYFLTTLLADPLQRNYNKSDRVKTEFLIKQKKEFIFKKRQSEIGGDMCVTDTLYLDGKCYTMFCNADAMGKSMQGAGGVLVMGTVFGSIIKRTLSDGYSRDIGPELWLRKTYEELHEVFNAFDGTMFISCVLGLVEEQSGFMYYFTAEHPLMALYRNGKASFIGAYTDLRKLGNNLSSTFEICTFQLTPGDVVIAGSDGRDDIRITGPDDELFLNDDENLFLEIVEESGADLEGILQTLNQRGKLTDDISIIRVGFLDVQGTVTQQA